ncbi:nuclear transport factor 2 family protein [Algoriphagus sp.]|uniref:nuclear transport factor 2 family protein n=1 Tax=Algoriphagus sp. TaxID=1872435 RepID=UPI003299FBD0
MKVLSLVVLFSIFTYFGASAQNCMSEANIKALDARWEQANLNPDPEFIENLLSDNFTWVHNHAGTIDTKEKAVDRSKKQKAAGTSNTRSRIQSDVKVAITGNTAIVTGFTVVDRDPTTIKYHFMRTYVEVDGNCLLVGNHTMAVTEME